MRYHQPLRRGQTLVEACLAMAILTIVLYSFETTTGMVFTVFKNAQIQNLVSTQIEPVRALLDNQVRKCRFALYSTVAGAETLDSTKLLAVASTGNNLNCEFALRCTRRDGAGVFILAWQKPAGSDPGFYIIPGQVNGINLGNQFSAAIPFSRAFCFFQFDVSHGYLQTTMSVPAPANGGYSSTQAVITRSQNVNNIPAVTFNVLTESNL